MSAPHRGPGPRPGRRLAADELTDWPDQWAVPQQRVLARGRIFDLVEDRIATPDEDEITRQYIRHPGAVGVIALDADDQLVLVRQYRHPVRQRLLEPPAGLLDVAGEDLLTAARRELAEEVGLAGHDWRVLADMFTSPGMGDEAVRIFLARDLVPADPPEGFVLAGEEADMEIVTAPLDQVVTAVLAGRVRNPLLVTGALACAAALSRGGFDTLRPGDAAPETSPVA